MYIFFFRSKLSVLVFYTSLYIYFLRWFLDTFGGLDKFICMFVFVHFIFSLVFLVGRYHIVIVSRVVITNCSSLVNFLLIYVITACYVIIFAMLCNLLYSKLTDCSVASRVVVMVQW